MKLILILLLIVFLVACQPEIPEVKPAPPIPAENKEDLIEAKIIIIEEDSVMEEKESTEDPNNEFYDNLDEALAELDELENL